MPTALGKVTAACTYGFIGEIYNYGVYSGASDTNGPDFC